MSMKKRGTFALDKGLQIHAISPSRKNALVVERRSNMFDSRALSFGYQSAAAARDQRTPTQSLRQNGKRHRLTGGISVVKITAQM
jgi:hypothetical protein